MARFLIHYERRRLFFPIRDTVVVSGCHSEDSAVAFAKNKISGRLEPLSTMTIEDDEGNEYHQISPNGMKKGTW